MIISDALLAVVLLMPSCFCPKKISQRFIPTAVNTINSVCLDELNLKHGSDYTIVSNVTGEAIIIYQEQRKGDKIIIKPKSVIRLFHAYTTFFLLSFLSIFSYNGPPLRLQTDKKSNQK